MATYAGFDLFLPPAGEALPLPSPPRLASWDRAAAPSQRRLRASLAEVDALLAATALPRQPWALELDVAVAADADLEEAGDLDNFLFPLLGTRALRGARLASAWARKSHRSGPSTLRLAPAVTAAQGQAPAGDGAVARTTCSASLPAWKRAVQASVAQASAGRRLPSGPVALEVAFLVGPRRRWANLWKPAIDALAPVLGASHPARPFHPRDGRIVALGLHCTVGAWMGNAVELAFWWRDAT